MLLQRGFNATTHAKSFLDMTWPLGNSVGKTAATGPACVHSVVQPLWKY